MSRLQGARPHPAPGERSESNPAHQTHMFNPLRRRSWGILLALVCLSTAFSLGVAAERRILVYTKNQVGPGLFVHDNIAASVAVLKKLGQENNITVEVSDDPKAFTDENLKRFMALVFDNTNNEIFENEDQKAAFQRYIRAGGGFVGLHSACGSMRNWPWFWSMLGGKFKRHPALQPFTIKVKDTKDPATAHLPESFQWTDEFYFLDHMSDDLHVLLAGDLTTLKDKDKEKFADKKFGDELPLAWRHEFDGGREWYSALGHKGEYYSDPRLSKFILGGILWAMGETK